VQPATQITGIPIEWLLTVIGGLVCAIYASLLYEVRKVRNSGEKRDKRVTVLQANIHAICAKLGIDVFSGDNDGD
jgi:hypothetical protein